MGGGCGGKAACMWLLHACCVAHPCLDRSTVDCYKHTVYTYIENDVSILAYSCVYFCVHTYMVGEVGHVVHTPVVRQLHSSWVTSHQVTAHMPSNLSATHQVIKQLLCNWVVFPLVYTLCIAMIPSFAFELSIWHLCCSTCTHVLLIKFNYCKLVDISSVGSITHRYCCSNITYSTQWWKLDRCKRSLNFVRGCPTFLNQHCLRCWRLREMKAYQSMCAETI